MVESGGQGRTLSNKSCTIHVSCRISCLDDNFVRLTRVAIVLCAAF